MTTTPLPIPDEVREWVDSLCGGGLESDVFTLLSDRLGAEPISFWWFAIEATVGGRTYRIRAAQAKQAVEPLLRSAGERQWLRDKYRLVGGELTWEVDDLGARAPEREDFEDRPWVVLRAEPARGPLSGPRRTWVVSPQPFDPGDRPGLGGLEEELVVQAVAAIQDYLAPGGLT